MFDDRQATVGGLLAVGKKDRPVGRPKRSPPFEVANVGDALIDDVPGFNLLHESGVVFERLRFFLRPAEAGQPDNARKGRR